MGTAVAVRARETDLLRAATRLFRERGFHATSMQDLAEALGMNRGSLYHYIESKDDLLWSIALGLLNARVEPMLTGHGEAAQRLADGIREHLHVAADHADELSLVQIELRSLTDERRRTMIQRRNAYEDLWRNALNDGIASGQLRQDADVRLAGIGILSACNWFTQWYRPDGPMSVDQIADGFIALFLQGVQAPGAGA
jgi:TetR/AcrR family transcriptional regulator, cholesterol catabolism regulator